MRSIDFHFPSSFIWLPWMLLLQLTFKAVILNFVFIFRPHRVSQKNFSGCFRGENLALRAPVTGKRRYQGFWSPLCVRQVQTLMCSVTCRAFYGHPQKWTVHCWHGETWAVHSHNTPQALSFKQAGPACLLRLWPTVHILMSFRICCQRKSEDNG